MKKAILSVSYCSSDKEQIDATIARVENLYRHTFPDCEISRAFTSRYVLGALHKAGIHVDTVPEALDRLAIAGFDEVYVQPTHIIAGGEYDSILDCADEWKDLFRVLRIGKPLLDTEEDNMYICRYFAHEFVRNNRALVFMGHGSEHPENDKYTKLQATAKRLGYDTIFIMTLEAKPSVEDIIPMIREAGLSKILLTPLLFGAAGHAKRDMASDAPGSVASILRANGFDVECLVKGLGEYDAIAELYARHLRSAMAG